MQAVQASLFLLYVIGIVAAAILTVLLIWVPFKLYAIAGELKFQSEAMRTQTRLLASLANQSAPADSLQ